jgi:hypothetical protein
MNRRCEIFGKKLAKYLVIPNILLNTHLTSPPTFIDCFIKGTKGRKYFEYSNINQQIFFTDVRYYRYSADYTLIFTALFAVILRKTRDIFPMLSKLDTMLSKFGAMLQKLDTMLQKLDTMLPKLDTMLQKLDTMLPKLDTMLRKLDTMLRKLDTMLQKLDTMLSKLIAMLLKLNIKINSIS